MPQPSTLPYQQRDQALKEQKADWRRRWFGPPRAEVWSRLATELNAKFESGKWFSGERVSHGVGPWMLTLDHYVVPAGKVYIPFTRIRSPYLTADNFRFSITKANLFTPVAKLLGAQDVAAGHADFDERFVVKATDEAKVKELLADAKLRARLLAMPEVALSAQDDEGYFGATFGANVDELYAVLLGDVRDLDRLHALFDIAADAMERLHAIGTAQPGETGIKR